MNHNHQSPDSLPRMDGNTGNPQTCCWTCAWKLLLNLIGNNSPNSLTTNVISAMLLQCYNYFLDSRRRLLYWTYLFRVELLISQAETEAEAAPKGQAVESRKQSVGKWKPIHTRRNNRRDVMQHVCRHKIFGPTVCGCKVICMRFQCHYKIRIQASRILLQQGVQIPFWINTNLKTNGKCKK